jgi:protoporphyrinogen oxidase
MGVRDRIIYPRPKTSYWINGRNYRSEISPSALFLPLSPLAKLRFALAGAYIKLLPNGLPLERTTTHQWMLKYMGQEAYDKFFRPLLIGKFGDLYQDVNMAWMWARVRARSLRLGTYKGGFQAFMNTLAEKVQARGAELRLNAPVEKISMADGRPALTVAGETHIFDRVLSTTSPRLLLNMADDLAETPYGRQVAELRSIGGLCVVFALRQSLLTDGTYWLNLPATSPDKSKSRFPFLALVEHTHWLPREHYNGDVIVYCGDYVPGDHEYFQMSEAALADRFAAVLNQFNADFKPDWIRKWWVFRAPYAQPVPGINHSQKIPPLKTPLPGLYWASMSQVYPWDRGTNYAVEIGRRAARELLG